VDDQRQLGLLRGLDVDAKAVALPFHVGHGALAQTVIVEAGFANAHHFGQLGAGQQVVKRGFLHAFVVGVHAHGGPEVIELRG
jgi:hypothetical protein